MEAQFAIAVREAFIREGINTSEYYIRTVDYVILEEDIFQATMEIVDGELNSSQQIFHIVETTPDFFEVIK